jgi:hypothetical protein
MGKQNVKAGGFQLAQQVAQQQAAEQAKQDAASQESTTPAVTQEGVNDQSNEGSQEQSKDVAQDSAQESSESKEQASDDIVIQPTVVTPAPAAAPVVAKAIVVEKSQPAPANATLTEKLGEILKDVPPAHQTDINRVVLYLERMTPKRPIDAKTGIAEQVALYRSIQNIINRQEDYFTQLFSALLFIFKSEAKGALSDRYRLRFMDNVTLATGDRKAFANITHALALLADAQSRPLAMRQLNLGKALENGLTAAGQQRVLHYFDA